MFYRGWKFNMFNDMKQINKAISAVVIIFAMFFFSLASLLTQLLDNKKSDHQSLSLVIFTYTMICVGEDDEGQALVVTLLIIEQLRKQAGK